MQHSLWAKGMGFFAARCLWFKYELRPLSCVNLGKLLYLSVLLLSICEMRIQKFMPPIPHQP